MKRPPVIFISSVFEGFEYVRDQIYKIITEEYGWGCNEYRNTSEKWLGSPVSTSSDKVDEADLYIGLFWKSIGSKGIENIPITEIEYLEAQNNQIPIKIFEINTPSLKRELALELLLEEVKDPDTGSVVECCKNFKDLIKKLKRFLDYFGCLWEKGEEGKLKPPSFLYELVKKYKDRLFELEPTQVVIPPVFLKKPLNEDEVLATLRLMHNQYHSSKYYCVIETGAKLWHFFLSDKNIKNNRMLSSFADFLGIWSGSCTWLGMTSFPYGMVTTAKLRKEVFQRLNLLTERSNANSLISHANYVQARILRTQARNIHLSILRTGNKNNNTKLYERFETERKSKECLKKALLHNDIYRIQG